MASPSGRSREERYAALASRLDPNASREEMEAAIQAEFGDDPGFSEAYKEAVKLDGEWYDLVGAYGSPEAKWHGMMLKREPSSGGYGSYTMASLADPMAMTQQSAATAAPWTAASASAPIAKAAYAPLAGVPMSELAHTDAVVQELLAAAAQPRDRAYLRGRRDPAFLQGRRDSAFRE